MDGEAIIAIIDARGPAQVSEIVGFLKDEGIEATNAEATAALRKLETQGKVAHTPRDNWRLAGERAREKSAARRLAAKPTPAGVRTRAFIYCPEIIRDSPRLTRNTMLHFVSYENGGFRLRDYVDGHRVEVKEVAGITKSVFLQNKYTWTEFEFDAEEAATPLTDNEFWEQRIAAANKAHAKLLAEGKAVISAGSGV
jgi:hypothetical protein